MSLIIIIKFTCYGSGIELYNEIEINNKNFGKIINIISSDLNKYYNEKLSNYEITNLELYYYNLHFKEKKTKNDTRQIKLLRDLVINNKKKVKRYMLNTGFENINIKFEKLKKIENNIYEIKWSY